MRIIKEFFEFIGANKKLFLIPVFILLILFGLVLLTAQGASILRMVYPV
jgi:hypothetical protein